MSVEAITWAWDLPSVKDGTEMVILLCYANYANDEAHAWPSKATVAKKSRTSLATVKRVVKSFCERQILIVDGRVETKATSTGKARYTTRYRLNLSPISDTYGVHPEPAQHEPAHSEPCKEENSDIPQAHSDPAQIAPGQMEDSTRVTVTPDYSISITNISTPPPARAHETSDGLRIDQSAPFDWRPPDHIVERLIAHKNIPRDFILNSDRVFEFVEYWRNRNEPHGTWGSKYLKHVIRDWELQKEKQTQQQRQQQQREQRHDHGNNEKAAIHAAIDNVDNTDWADGHSSRRNSSVPS